MDWQNIGMQVVGVALCCFHPLITVGLAIALLDAKGILHIRSPFQWGSGHDEESDL
jgi:hypothetical protein